MSLRDRQSVDIDYAIEQEGRGTCLVLAAPMPGDFVAWLGIAQSGAICVQMPVEWSGEYHNLLCLHFGRFGLTPQYWPPNPHVGPMIRPWSNDRSPRRGAPQVANFIGDP